MTAATVAALSSGAPPCGVAVVRVSGPRVRFVLETMAGGVPEPRSATLRAIRNSDGQVIDRALVLFFPGPRSFTGEDVCEIHCHGSRAVVDAVLRGLWGLEGVEPAAAGDFTRQAFANGRMDLTQVEGLGDLLAATTDAQRAFALAQLEGSARSRIEGWAERLLTMRALVEAELDFSDEGDVPDTVTASLGAGLAELGSEMAADLEGGIEDRLRDGFRVVLAGAPNSGKSTLLNALLRREAALVSPVAGTTRDVIEAPVDLGGLPVLLIDTAGLRGEGLASDAVEAMGIERARRAIAGADCVVWLDGGDGADEASGLVSEMVDAARLIRVRSKCDLDAGAPDAAVLALSGRTGAGLPYLVERVRQRLAGEGRSVRLDRVAVTAERRAGVDAALRAVRRAGEGLGSAGQRLELTAEDLRQAQSALDRLVGRSDVEDVLDRLFARFCIGK